MYKGLSAAYCIIIFTYWQLAFLGYWAFGSEVEPYVLSSLSTPKWTIIMAHLFAVIQISGCFQVITNLFQTLEKNSCYILLIFFSLSRFTVDQHMRILKQECHQRSLVVAALLFGITSIVCFTHRCTLVL